MVQACREEPFGYEKKAQRVFYLYSEQPMITERMKQDRRNEANGTWDDQGSLGGGKTKERRE